MNQDEIQQFQLWERKHLKFNVGKRFAHAKPWPSGECFGASCFLKAITESKNEAALKQTLASMLARNANVLQEQKAA